MCLQCREDLVGLERGLAHKATKISASPSATADEATDSLVMEGSGEITKVCTDIHVHCFRDENLKWCQGPECINRS